MEEKKCQADVPHVTQAPSGVEEMIGVDSIILLVLSIIYLFFNYERRQ